MDLNWDMVGAIAEILGAAGVIATLFYLAIQIRQSTRTERARSFQYIFAELNHHANYMFNAENAPLIAKGMTDFKSLSGTEHMRFDLLMRGYVNYLEATLFNQEAEILGIETMDNWAHEFATRFLPYIGVRDWWKEASEIFAPETRAFMEGALARTDVGSDFWRIK